MHNVTHFPPRHFSAAFVLPLENTMTVKEHPPQRKMRGRAQPPTMPDRTPPTVTEFKVSILWGLYVVEKRKVIS